MGRPIKKSLIGNILGKNNQLTISAWLPGDTQARTGYIVRQEATGVYTCRTVNNTNVYVNQATLVNGPATAQGQCSIPVTPFLAGGSGATANAVVGIATQSIVSTGTSNYAASYKPGEVLSVFGGTDTAVATLNVLTVGARIANVATSSNGFTVGDTLTVGGAGWNSNAVVSVATTTGNGAIGSVNFISNGSFSNPTLPTNPLVFTVKTSTNVIVGSATFNVGYGVGNTSIAAVGSYSAIPSNPVALTGSAAGVGATANVSWFVNGVTVSNAGSGYNAAPTIAFAGGNASAVATLSGSGVGSITVTSGNTATYSNIPIVSINALGAVEYAAKVNDKTVVTFAGNQYVWYPTGTVLTAVNQATIPTG